MTTKLAALVVCVGLTATTSPPCFAQQNPPAASASIDPAVKAAALCTVQTALPESNYRAMMTTLIPAMAKPMLQARGAPQAVTDEILGVLTDEINTMDMTPLYEILSVSYAKRFSLAELDDLAGFYQSPTGKKLLAFQPEMAREATVAGRIWGTTRDAAADHSAAARINAAENLTQSP
jgi:uncharacterized protein